MKPVRIQRSRAKGSRLTSPNGLPIVCVDRSSKKWGNPMKIPVVKAAGGRFRPGGRQARNDRARAQVLAMFRDRLLRSNEEPWATMRASLHELRGKNLACWCRDGQACHADVLLELANQ